MPNLGWTEILIILVIVLLLFGANKLPDLARSMGRSARIFKSEVKEMQNDDKPANDPRAELPRGTVTPAPETQSAATPQDGFWDRPENQPRPRQ
ncbi:MULTISPECIES: Sec-independent protein translocase subunit TatA [unclassified Corynebacterium]|uniref:Sec-independent protein translocase subunit TatA n=1 Tax=unclassified Corynebacterium TaxID=2624378 RepID=UPI002A920630|nr:Sec-independent protein translocase subunit TatA [Corynebacterium sp.]MDY5785477.1 Sec-independent protein translocase subunit TatA [Corynebacterium sp.]